MQIGQIRSERYIQHDLLFIVVNNGSFLINGRMIGEVLPDYKLNMNSKIFIWREE